jgi:hypothetical protein
MENMLLEALHMKEDFLTTLSKEMALKKAPNIYLLANSPMETKLKA